MRRLAPLLSLLLAVPNLALAAPKDPAGKRKATKPTPTATRQAKDYVVCPTLSFTPEPLVIEGLYTSRVGTLRPSARYVQLHTKLIGKGLILEGLMAEGRRAKQPRFEQNFFHRLDKLPISDKCKIAEGQSGWTHAKVLASDNIEITGEPVLDEVTCEMGTPRCELTFKPMSIRLEPKSAGCEQTRAKIFGPHITVLARPDGVAPRFAEPSIDFGLEERHEATGVVYRGVMTAVPPRNPTPRRTKRTAAPMYRGTFRVDHVVNAEVVRTLYPGCAIASNEFTDDTLSVPATTNEPDVLMQLDTAASRDLFSFATCTWRGTGVDRVLACHLQMANQTVDLVDDLR